jgi:putative membrane protein
MSDMYEIDAARIAEARSRNAEVKKFAAMMVADHSKSSAALKAIVAKSPALGPLPTRLDTAHAMMIADLKAADAAKFDKLYLNQQITAHQNTESLLSNYATDGSDAALKNFASTTVPKVAGHLHMVQTMTGDALAGPVAPVG